MIKISGLPAGVTNSDLEKLFCPYGKITVRDITTEENKSIALIELDGNIGAAVDKLDGKPFRGQFILTVEAHPSVPYPDGTVARSYNREMPKQLLSKDKKDKNSSESRESRE